jgi:hypothetical protein
MASDEKNIKSLIKKIQKKCEAKVAAREAKKEKVDVVTEEYKEATDIFREMKKLPFAD